MTTPTVAMLDFAMNLAYDLGLIELVEDDDGRITYQRTDFARSEWGAEMLDNLLEAAIEGE